VGLTPKQHASGDMSKNANYKDTHRNKPESYVLELIAIMGVLLISFDNLDK
jgi:hypothetical protein